ncbi:hypothetical protein [Vibrio sp. WXL103]|uniref:hypothetical protein n=1 Tax=unclassified Vibrio TaxID=2614977 RepID=UPI003EC84333
MINRLMVGLLLIGLSACSTLDSSSDFSQAIEQVLDRGSHYQITGQAYSPDFNTLRGADVIKATLSLEANFAKPQRQAPKSVIFLTLNYFRTFDTYQTVTIDGQTMPLHTTQPPSSMCNEHCTITQHLAFNLEPAALERGRQQGLSFTLSSAGKSAVSEFFIPAGYIDAIAREALAKSEGSQAEAVDSPEQGQEVTALSMTQYWYPKASLDERHQFEGWALRNRDGDVESLGLTSTGGSMLEYWYQQATPSERKQILAWLITQ